MTWQFLGPSVRTMRGVAVPALIFYAIGAFAQSSPAPTAAELQTIQKCQTATTKTDTEIAASIDARAIATAASAQVNSLTSDTSVTAAQTFNALTAALRKLGETGLPGALADRKTSLNKQKDALTSACGPDVTTPRELVDARAAAKTAAANVDAEATAIDKVTTSLNAALDGIPAAAKNVFDSLSAKINDLKSLAVPIGTKVRAGTMRWTELILC